MSFLYTAFGWVLCQIYNLVGNYGIAIILFTILFKFILLPLNLKQTKSMKEMAALAPEVEKIKKKYKNNPEKQNQETQKLYKTYGVSMAAGCLPLLVQLPIIYGLFGALRDPATYVFANGGAEAIEQPFLWLTSLGDADPYYILPILCAVFTFLMQLLTQKYQTNSASMEGSNKIMLVAMPLLIGFAATRMPAGVALYWAVQNVFTMVQQWISFRRPVKLVATEEAERRLQEKKQSDKKEKLEQRKQQSDMRMKAMGGKTKDDHADQKKKNRPKMKTASGKKVQRKTITKIPQRQEGSQKTKTKIPERKED